MRDTTNFLKRQLQQIAKRVKRHRPTQISLEGLLRISEGAVEPTPAEQAFLIEHQRQNELNYDPPDRVERKLARMIAKAEGQPDPYGTDGMSETKRRARDWSDYHERERLRCKESAHEEPRLPIGLRELRPSEAIPMC
jgi:hypothetical protein